MRIIIDVSGAGFCDIRHPQELPAFSGQTYLTLADRMHYSMHGLKRFIYPGAL